MRILVKVLVLSLSFLFLSLPTKAENSQWVEWIIEGQAAYSHLDNLNYSAFSNDSENDAKLTVGVVLGRFYQISGNSRMHIAVDASKEQYDEFNLWDETQLGASIGFRHKFGLGHYIPYLQMNASHRHNEIDSDRWSHDLSNIDIEVGKHISESFSIATGIGYSLMNGKSWQVVVPELSNEVFDQEYWQAFIVADYIITQDWLLSFNYNYRSGDFHSACTVENVAKVLATNKVKAITFDDVFGGCIYQTDGHHNSYSGGVSYALTDHSAFNFIAQYTDGSVADLNYHSSTMQFNYNYRF